MRSSVDDLILLNMAGIGYIKLKSMLEYFGSTEEAFKVKEDYLQEMKDIGPTLAQKIYRVKTGDNLKKEKRLIKKHKLNIISIFDKSYPENLRRIYNPPIVLYIKGQIKNEDNISVALVGSRKASLYGTNMCTKLSSRLAGAGVTIVSGLARGIDTAAHKGAIESSGRTFAVLGNGLSFIYPPENRKLASEVAENGAVISEFPMEKQPYPQNFPMRNRIISGLSLGVVVVEAAQKSGALITADYALNEGREVFAVPGRANSITSTGAHRLIQNGARLVEEAGDILEELNIAPVAEKALSKAEEKNMLAKKKRLKALEKRLYGILSDEPLHIDKIIKLSGLSPGEAVKHLLSLEMKKFVKELPGKNFVSVDV